MLRRHFGISAHEALHVVPLWEQELLIAGLAEELSGPPGHPEQQPLGPQGPGPMTLSTEGGD